MSYCSPLLQIAGQTSLLSPLNVLFHLSVLLLLFPSAVKMLYCKDGSVTLRSICSFIDTKRRSDRQISNSGVEGNVDKTDS